MAPKSTCSPERMPRSAKPKNTAAIADIIKTINVVSRTSRRVGQKTFETSERTCCMNRAGFVIAMSSFLSLAMLDRQITDTLQGIVYTLRHQRRRWALGN